MKNNNLQVVSFGENCCTPVGQIKRYVNCIGCDRKPFPKEKLNIKKLETKLHTALENETEESLENWLNSKQETLEEAMNKEGYHESDYDKIWREGVQFGAKWQVERMYSNIEVFTEELKDKIDSFEYSVNQNSYISDYIKEWFEQFKKK